MLSPKWMLSHLGVVALVVAMIIAGLWQIDRHQERSDRNDTIRARSNEEPVPLPVALAPGPTTDLPLGEELQFRRVLVAGSYQPDDQVLVRNRTFDGAPGYWVLTPLLMGSNGPAAIVNRGWVPLSFADGDPRLVPPSGRVEIVGSIQPTREAEGLQQADPATGRLSTMARPDIVRLAEQLDYQVVTVVVQLEPDGETTPPLAIPLPALDAGPHASYAAQWFIFTAIALVGYPLVLRRVARGDAESLPTDDDHAEMPER